MIFGAFLLLVALSISAVAAFYSIAGLTAIFAAAVVPIIIMGAVLETGKIAATVWLHRYWDQAALQFKLYLIPAILILMLITSMGIFGFLSKAHLDQTAPAGDIAAQVAMIDERINTERENIQSQRDNIADAKLALTQLDTQVTELLGRTTSERGANRAVQIRRQQAKERAVLQKEIAQAQTEIESINSKIALLNEERAPLAAEVRKVEAEVGPIKYIAALIYGDNPDANLLERAVRWVIILLVLVFDPLALVLILAAEQTFVWAKQERANRKGWHQEWVPDSEAWPEWDNESVKYEPDDGPLTADQIQTIQKTANVDIGNVVIGSSLFDEELKVREFFDHGKELARTIDDNDGKFDFSKHPYLMTPNSWIKNSTGEGLVSKNTFLDHSADEFLESIEDSADNDNYSTTLDQEPIAQENIDYTAEKVPVRPLDPEPIRPVPAPAIDTEPIVTVPYNRSVKIPDLSITSGESAETHAGFGTEFPVNPSRGDVFLRVDYLPSRLFKWNDKKWIEIDKERSDQFTYDEMYIKHLVEKLQSGEYDIELLTDLEQEQIQRYLNNDNSNQ